MVTEEAERRIMETVKGSYKAILKLYNVHFSDEEIDANIGKYRELVLDLKAAYNK